MANIGIHFPQLLQPLRDLQTLWSAVAAGRARWGEEITFPTAHGSQISCLKLSSSCVVCELSVASLQIATAALLLLLTMQTLFSQSTAFLTWSSHIQHVIFCSAATHFSYRNKHCYKWQPCHLHFSAFLEGLNSLDTWPYTVVPSAPLTGQSLGKAENKSGTQQLQLHFHFKNCWECSPG